MTPVVDVLIPTRNRPVELATVLAGLAAQRDAPSFRVVVSDQSDDVPSFATPAAEAMARVLRRDGRPVEFVRRAEPRRGLAEHRAFLLSLAVAPRVLFLDDDVWLEPDALTRMNDALHRLGCGFVGSAVQGLSYLDDERPEELTPYEEWDGPPVPELIQRGSPAWSRWTLHNAANPSHLARRLGLSGRGWRAYKIAWVGGCVLYDRGKLESCGGFGFWPDLPVEHAGEDVAAQWRVMARFGGTAVLPSGAIHLESPTTVPNREVNAPDVLPLG
jgi:GT2 family glycosyltransferase